MNRIAITGKTREQIIPNIILFAFRIMLIGVTVSLFCLCIVVDVLTVFSSSECNGFEADWKWRKMNTSEVKIPVSYGTVIPIHCFDGYQKLSGPGAVTCIQNTTFYGLDNISCVGEYLKIPSRK